MRRPQHLAALLVAGLLGVTGAVGVSACSSEGGRENVERSNEGDKAGENSSVETGGAGLTSTAPPETGVTQTQP